LSFARSRCSFRASYGGLSKFKPKGYTKKEVREWLQSQDTYTLHKPTRRRFTRRRVVVNGIDHQWQADLVPVLDFFPSVSWCFWRVRSNRGGTLLSFARSRCSFRLSDVFPVVLVTNQLQSQDTYTLHKPTRRRFPRRQVVVYGIDHQWQADLVDLAKLSSYNKGFRLLRNTSTSWFSMFC
jgi:hypothetical protein